MPVNLLKLEMRNDQPACAGRASALSSRIPPLITLSMTRLHASCQKRQAKSEHPETRQSTATDGPIQEGVATMLAGGSKRGMGALKRHV